MSTSDSTSQVSIDSIVFTGQAKVWLIKYDLMPSSWKLNQAEVDRILAARLALTIFNSPACTIPLADVQQRIPQLQNVIQIDSHCIEGPDLKGPFVRGEAIAVILHEIGHVVNPAPTEDCYNEEGWADDYARHCGYQACLMSALQKLKAAACSEAVSDLIQARISRIERGDIINTRW